MKVRANEFDKIVGAFQTEKVMELPGDSILDVGCGTGMYTPMYLKKFDRVVGLDPVPFSDKSGVEYYQGYGESFKLKEKFDVISLCMLLEHVDNPIKVLVNCKKHLAKNGVIIAQVPNEDSISRRLGVLMGIIGSVKNISKREKDYFGHKRTYNLVLLISDFIKAKLSVSKTSGVMYKPLPNEMLQLLCEYYGTKWAKKFVYALYNYGNEHPDGCAAIYCIGE